MRLVARFIVRFGYYYSQALGFLHFHYHFDSGRVRSSTLLSLYSFAVSLLLVATTPLQFLLNIADGITAQSRYFMQHLFEWMMIWRTVSIILTLTTNWLMRRKIAAIVADFQRLHRQHFARLRQRPATKRRFENGLVRKFLLMVLSDGGRFLLMLGTAPDSSQFWWSCAMCLILSALHMVLNMVFFATECLGWHYELLNDEQLRVLRAFKAASRLRRSHQGTFGERCAQLADELDQLLAIRRELRALTRRVNEVANVQSGCVTLNLYLFNISAIYMIYSMLKSNGLEQMHQTVGSAAVLLFNVFVYYCDLRELIASNFRLLHSSQVGVRLLQQELQLEFLGVQLERSVEQFCLQDACDPLVISMLGLCNVNGASVFATSGSTFAHSIIIIQYDYKNF